MHYPSQADIETMAGKETAAGPAWTPEEVRAMDGRKGLLEDRSVVAGDLRADVDVRVAVGHRAETGAYLFLFAATASPGTPPEATTYRTGTVTSSSTGPENGTRQHSAVATVRHGQLSHRNAGTPGARTQNRRIKRGGGYSVQPALSRNAATSNIRTLRRPVSTTPRIRSDRSALLTDSREAPIQLARSCCVSASDTRTPPSISSP